MIILLIYNSINRLTNDYYQLLCSLELVLFNYVQRYFYRPPLEKLANPPFGKKIQRSPLDKLVNLNFFFTLGT